MRPLYEAGGFLPHAWCFSLSRIKQLLRIDEGINIYYKSSGYVPSLQNRCHSQQNFSMTSKIKESHAIPNICRSFKALLCLMSILRCKSCFELLSALTHFVFDNDPNPSLSDRIFSVGTQPVREQPLNVQLFIAALGLIC